MEPNLIEETLNLVRELDGTDDPVKVACLQARIADRSDDIGELVGYALLTLEGEWLVCCLDETQARALQNTLLTIEGGFVTQFQTVSGSIEDFIHPETDVGTVAAVLLDREES